MEIEIIPLAQKKIERRGVSSEMIKETIETPDQIVLGYMNRKVRQRIYSINDKKMLLRVVCEEQENKCIVVTAYLTSEISRYWR